MAIIHYERTEYTRIDSAVIAVGMLYGTRICCSSSSETP